MNYVTPTSETPGETKQRVIRTCRNCFKTDDEEYFVKSKAFSCGVDTICLDCSRKKVKLWRKENPEKRKEQLKRESKKEYNHNKHLKATYGITRDIYLEMFNEQKGQCAICQRHQIDFPKRLSVDHCHTSGNIRALLCQNCNNILGDAKDNIDVLKKAIQYLEKYNG